MALNLKLPNASANAACDAVVDLLDGGYLRIYNGTQPATADTAISTQTLLAELTLDTPAFGSASNGVATAGTVTQDASANATGTATWFRAFRSDGTTVVMDGSCGTSDANLVLSTTAIVSGTPVSVTSWTFTASKG